MEKRWHILALTLILICVLGFFKYNTGYIKDLFFTAFLVIALFLLYKKIRLTPISYSLVCISLIVHDLGIFGFYANPPLFNIPYDYITHILGIFSVTLVIGNFLSYSLAKDRKFHFNDFMVLSMIFLAALGIGSIIETIEYGGYLTFGLGEGFFQFGTGDYDRMDIMDRLTLIVGGGYFDTMGDLICNSIGALSAVILFGVNFFVLKRNYV
jgi:uncharacterized membrane protein YjdF